MIQTLNHVYTGDCRDLIEYGVDLMCREGLTPVVVTDPPFNVGYHYDGYGDRMGRTEYMSMLVLITSLTPSVVVHYPEQLHALSIAKSEMPRRVVSWVYNSNTANIDWERAVKVVKEHNLERGRNEMPGTRTLKIDWH